MALFYNQPRAVQAGTHGATRLAPPRDLGFAATTNAIPIAADEFFVAQAHYPIVFTTEEQPTPVVVVGVRENENLFIAESGKWRAGGYVPAYIRRYPFALARANDSGQLVLVVDDAAEVISTQEGEPLFEDGKPSAVTERALQFCTAFQRQFDLGQELAAGLRDAGILGEKRIELRRPDGEVSYAFTGFRVADEDKLNQLADETFLDWRQRGWLPLIYAHLMSMRRWDILGMLQDGRRKTDTPAEPAEAQP
ncbi:MAG: SapC family protein [Alphaproteobacteria bacterium]|nr:SapC family protein [Alphaproteobacteria bacterium]